MTVENKTIMAWNLIIGAEEKIKSAKAVAQNVGTIEALSDEEMGEFNRLVVDAIDEIKQFQRQVYNIKFNN